MPPSRRCPVRRRKLPGVRTPCPSRVARPEPEVAGSAKSCSMSRTGWRRRPEAERPPGAPAWKDYAIKYMIKLDTELKEPGECVTSQALTGPSQARTVRFVDGGPVPTDGPFAEVKESLAGNWILDVDEERALQIAARVVVYTEYPMEVRRIMDHSARP
jgi:hypothetical protein